jgi:tocopherol O-methyltransferase
MILPREAPTPAAVAAHYDELDRFYREVWGEHVHHGYWATGRESAAEAADALVDLVAERLDLAPGQEVCDIGCGYGATAQRLAERHGVAVTGVTLSAAQAKAAAGRVAARGSLHLVRQDWLANGFPDRCFDRAYAIESTEHMADKQLFFAEAFRTLKPGGRLTVCAWLARPGARPWEVRHLLEPICREGRLAGMGEAADYRRLAEQAGLALVGAADLSACVRRTWWICARRLLARLATQGAYRRFLRDRTALNRVFALTLVRLLVAYRTGSMRYGLFVLERPAA